MIWIFVFNTSAKCAWFLVSNRHLNNMSKIGEIYEFTCRLHVAFQYKPNITGVMTGRPKIEYYVINYDFIFVLLKKKNLTHEWSTISDKYVNERIKLIFVEFDMKLWICQTQCARTVAVTYCCTAESVRILFSIYQNNYS